MKNNKWMLPLCLTGVVLGMTACSNVPYRCPLGEETLGCHSMDDTLMAARHPSDNPDSVFDEPIGGEAREEAVKKAKKQKKDKKEDSRKNMMPEYAFQPFMITPTRGQPVYTPPRPFRPYMGLWTDAEGRLHEGSYYYILRPGGWNYGTLNQRGSGSTMLEPARQTDANLGFKPSYEAPPTANPATGATNVPSSAQAQVAKQLEGVKDPAAPVNNNGITQPYKKLTD